MNAGLDKPARRPRFGWMIGSLEGGKARGAVYSRLLAAYALLTRDAWIAAVLFVAGLSAYLSSLAPTVLDGDAALFQ